MARAAETGIFIGVACVAAAVLATVLYVATPAEAEWTQQGHVQSCVGGNAGRRGALTRRRSVCRVALEPYGAIVEAHAIGQPSGRVTVHYTRDGFGHPSYMIAR